MSPVKEPCYFASEVRGGNFAAPFRVAALRNSEALHKALNEPAQTGPLPEGIVTDWDDYTKLFRGASHASAVGEASVCYLWSPSAAANIHAAIPHARILMILRDPAERAFSQYLHNARDGVVRRSFRQQIEHALRTPTSDFEPSYPFLENGMYFEQVKRYQALFPSAQIRVFLYHEAWQDPERFLAAVFEFLSVDPNFAPNVSARQLEQRAPRNLAANYLLSKSGAGAMLRSRVPQALRGLARGVLFKPQGSAAMEDRDREFLREYYRDDVIKLASLLQRDLNCWL